ncbi:hypothetical protein N0V93_008937 [Gnomoniopsis smithogilvyi]|uniref:Apple domain-containing protein n=1 Tax=Gnomoniopsis smithogilvyi TaxID=1191159 RepID=A0A9W8YLT5_9PEZI|nr:hypothetical protein N0V93_008937 [Gnomoniopsis smithogilvyi]
MAQPTWVSIPMLRIFAYATSGTAACILYDYVIEGHDTAYAASPYTFFNRGGVCAVTSSATSTTAATTTATPIPEPTCGLTGWEISGTNIGYYVSIATYSACNDLCNSDANCLSLAYATASNGTCVLYNHVVEGNVTADSTSPYTYFDRGSVCPQASTTSSTATASSTTPATPSFTAGVQYCPSGYTSYNVSNPVTGYTGCNSTYLALPRPTVKRRMAPDMRV